MERAPRTSTVKQAQENTRSASQRTDRVSREDRQGSRRSPSSQRHSSSQRPVFSQGRSSSQRAASSQGRSSSQRAASSQGRSSSQRAASSQGRSSSQRPASPQKRSSAQRADSVQKRSSSQSRSSAQKRPSSRRPVPGKRPASRKPSPAQIRRQAALGKRRRKLLIAIAALVVVIAVVVLIIVSSLTVQEPSDLQIESSDSTQILTWKGNPKRLTYQIFRKTAGTDFELVAQIPIDGECSYVSSDLESATQYEYKIVAVKGSGENARESEGILGSAYTLPAVPSNCSAQTLSKDSLTLSWDGSESASGYEVNYGTTKDLADASVLSFSSSDIEKNETTGQLTCQIPDLTVGTTYYCKVRGLCGEDIYSEWSDLISGTVTPAVDMTGVDVNKPMVALTFDDGPDKGEYTNRILDVLKNTGSHATFFQLGQLAETYPDVIKRIVEEGNEIACHTYDHSHMGDAVTAEDIIRANDAIEAVCGVRPTSFRCPGGSLTDSIREICRGENQPIFHWTVDTRDWASRDADAVMSEVETQGVSDGDIILLHNIYESSAEATERLVPWLQEQGFQVVSAAQLIQAKSGAPAVPGTQYFSASHFN